MKKLRNIFLGIACMSLFSCLFTAGKPFQTVKAAESVAYTLTPTQNKSNTAYATNYDVTINGKTWNVPGNQNISGCWRIGGKSLSNVDRVIYSKATVSASNITRVNLTHNGVSNSNLTVNSIKMIVASDANFTNVVSTVTVNSPSVSSAGNIDFEETPKSNWANKYFKFVFNVSNPNATNYGLDFTGAKFYTDPEVNIVEKTALSTPTGFSFSNDRVSWGSVANCTSGYSYMLKYSDETKLFENNLTTANNYIDVSSLSNGAYKIEVSAIGTGNYSNSEIASYAFTVNREVKEYPVLSNLTLHNGDVLYFASNVSGVNLGMGAEASNNRSRDTVRVSVTSNKISVEPKLHGFEVLDFRADGTFMLKTSTGYLNMTVAADKNYLQDDQLDDLDDATDYYRWKIENISINSVSGYKLKNVGSVKYLAYNSSEASKWFACYKESTFNATYTFPKIYINELPGIKENKTAFALSFNNDNFDFENPNAADLSVQLRYGGLVNKSYWDGIKDLITEYGVLATSEAVLTNSGYGSIKEAFDDTKSLISTMEEFSDITSFGFIDKLGNEPAQTTNVRGEDCVAFYGIINVPTRYLSMKVYSCAYVKLGENYVLFEERALSPKEIASLYLDVNNSDYTSVRNSYFDELTAIANFAA